LAEATEKNNMPNKNIRLQKTIKRFMDMLKKINALQC